MSASAQSKSNRSFAFNHMYAACSFNSMVPLMILQKRNQLDAEVWVLMYVCRHFKDRQYNQIKLFLNFSYETFGWCFAWFDLPSWKLNLLRQLHLRAALTNEDLVVWIYDDGAGDFDHIWIFGAKNYLELCKYAFHFHTVDTVFTFVSILDFS